MDTLFTTRRKLPDWRTLLMAAIAACLFCRVLLILFPIWDERWKFTFQLACMLLVGPVLGMTDVGKQWGMRLLWIAFAWIAATSLLHFSDYRDPELLMTYLLTAAVSIFLFYPAATVLGEAHGRKLFRLAGLTYGTCITLLSVAVLYAAFRGVQLPSPAGVECVGAGVYDVFGDYRLYMFCNPIEGGLYCAIALTVLLPLIADTRTVFLRVAIAVSVAILFCMLALSDARTPSWAFCVVVGGFAYLIVNKTLRGRHAVTRFLASALAAALAAALGFLLLRLTANLLNPLIPKLDTLREASKDAGDLSGRTEVWKSVFAMLRANPDVLWTGAGPMRGMSLVQPYFTFDDTVLAHPHAIVLSILITLGIPGLLIFSAFTAYIAFHAVRLFFFADDRAAFCERAIPLILVLCLVTDLIETFLSFSGAGDHSNPWFFLAAGYVVYLSKTRVPFRTCRQASVRQPDLRR